MIMWWRYSLSWYFCVDVVVVDPSWCYGSCYSALPITSSFFLLLLLGCGFCNRCFTYVVPFLMFSGCWCSSCCLLCAFSQLLVWLSCMVSVLLHACWRTGLVPPSSLPSGTWTWGLHRWDSQVRFTGETSYKGKYVKKRYFRHFPLNWHRFPHTGL